MLGLLFIPAVVAMYLLKLRRDETVVPSTLLWTRLISDVEANAPWQKLRRSLLLLLQLLLVAILALVAALGLIAVLATITTIQRILFVYRQSKSQEVTSNHG